MLLSAPQIRTSETKAPSRRGATRDKLHRPRSATLWPAPAVLRYWHLASLDAPTVAAVWSLAFAWVAGVRLAAWVIALQVLTVWTVYVGDRLLDARAGLRQPNDLRQPDDGIRQPDVDPRHRPAEDLRERHYFHWRHRRILVPAACIAACTAAWIAARCMPIVVKERDSLLAAASALYFTRVHAGRVRRLLRKELLVGILFAAGCALASASLTIAVPALFFAALAWLNCWAIETWESDAWQDDKDKSGKILLTEPRPAHPHSIAPRSIAIALACAGVITAAMLLHFAPRAAAMLAAGALSALLLALLDCDRQRMTAVAVRALADLVLLTPALLLATQSLPLRNLFR